MINELTKEQENQLSVYRDKWLKIGLSTESIDKKKASTAIDLMYKCGGLDAPEYKIFVDSPISMLYAYIYLQAIFSEQVLDQVRGQIGDQIMDRILNQVRDQISGQVREQVWDQVWDQVWYQVENADIEKTWKDIRFNIYHGSHDATWLSFYNYFQEVCGLECTKPLDGLFETAMHCGWILPFKNAAIICAKPNVIKFDSQNRLHCDSGPALSYNDGFGVFAWHGTRVASWVITNPELITIDKIFVEENAEIRRILMERYGLRKFGHDLITSGKASLIHEEEVWGEPVRYYKYNDKGARLGFVHVINGTVEPDGTKHEFILTVKADYKTASEAVYSTYPELMKRLDNLPEDVRMNILKQSIRT